MLFARRAFYRQASRVDLQPLDESDLGEYILDRFKTGGKAIGPDALGALLDRSEGHPRAAMLLSHELWGRSHGPDPADLTTYYEAERAALEKAASDLRAIWRGLARSDRELLTKLAHGATPYSRTEGGNAKPGGVVKAAITRLEDAGEIIERSDVYRIVDPFFGELIRRDWAT